MSKLVFSGFFLANGPKHDEIVLKSMVQHFRQLMQYPTRGSRGIAPLVVGETILCVLIG